MHKSSVPQLCRMSSIPSMLISMEPTKNLSYTLLWTVKLLYWFWRQLRWLLGQMVFQAGLVGPSPTSWWRCSPKSSTSPRIVRSSPICLQTQQGQGGCHQHGKTHCPDLSGEREYTWENALRWLQLSVQHYNPFWYLSPSFMIWEWADSKHRSATMMCAQSHPVALVHSLLYKHLRIHYRQLWDSIQGWGKGTNHWCLDNNLSLNISKTKEMIVDYRKQQGVMQQAIYISNTEFERVKSLKFLRVNMSEDLSWTVRINNVLRKAHQRLFFLRRLKKFVMNRKSKASWWVVGLYGMGVPLPTAGNLCRELWRQHSTWQQESSCHLGHLPPELHTSS